MWQEYLTKTILVKELEDDRDYPRHPVAYTILAVKVVELNELAYVINTNGEMFWVYPSKYIVMSVTEASDIHSAWYGKIGCSLLCTPNGSNDVNEIIPVKTRGDYALVKFRWTGEMNTAKTMRWINTNDYAVHDQMFQEQ